MNLPLAFLAVVEAAEPTMMDRFGVEPKYVIIQAFSFLILFGVLYWFGIKPVLATMGERQEKISAGLKHAEEMRLKLEETHRATESQIQAAQVKGQQIVAEAQKSAKEFLDKQNQEAVERSNALLTKAQLAIELEKKKMLAEARVEIARLVVATTQRVLSKELSDAERSRYNESAAREMSQV